MLLAYLGEVRIVSWSCHQSTCDLVTTEEMIINLVLLGQENTFSCVQQVENHLIFEIMNYTLKNICKFRMRTSSLRVLERDNLDACRGYDWLSSHWSSLGGRTAVSTLH